MQLPAYNNVIPEELKPLISIVVFFFPFHQFFLKEILLHREKNNVVL